MFSKKGVSLVAVLLFMLVATIASTATYKWLTSAQFSSASKMKMIEAQQASRTGLDAVRAWMTFHANDVGGIIHQYYTNENKPIELTHTVSNFASSKQEYTVWLTGVETNESPYKLKITSVGKGRDGTKYIEHSILKVDGLYNVNVPSKSGKSADFKEAFFGGGSTIALDASSAIINGDLDIISTFNSTDYFMVTGNLKVNSSTQAKDLYVNGSVEGCNDLQVSGNAFIGDYFYAPGNSSFLGGLYAASGVDFTKGGCTFASFKAGDLTVEGDIALPTVMTEVKMEVNGNLVTLNNGKLKFPKHGECNNGYGGICAEQQYTFYAKGNVYLDGGVNDGSHRSMGFTGSNVQLGSNDKSVYVGSDIYLVDFSNVNGTSYTDMYSNVPITDETLWRLCDNIWSVKSVAHSFCASFNENDNTAFFRIRGEKVSSANPTTWKANRLQEYADKITTEASPGCGTKPHVPDPLQFNTAILEGSYVHSASNRKECTMENGVWINEYAAYLWNPVGDGGVVWAQMNTCRTLAAQQDLYKNDWYVIKLEGDRSIWTDNTTILDGNYIIIVALEEVLGQPDWNGKVFPKNSVTLPATTATSNVILYFPPGHSVNVQLEPGEHHNYFIFSESNLTFNQNEKRKIDGSIYMSDCHEMNSVNTIDVTYNSAMTDFITSSEIICANDGSKNCTGASSGGSSLSPGTPGSETTVKDEYFVGNAPQLNITLESQYKNNETDPESLPTGQTSQIEPSIVLMPRVIYMTQDPIGKLDDYYNIINLNGANEQKNSSSISCSNGNIPTTSDLFDGVNPLHPDVYNCEYDSKYGKVPFWIEVKGKTEETPTIKLQTEYQQIYPGDATPAMVNLIVPQSSRTSMSVDIFVSAFPDKWHIVPQTGVVERTGATFATGNGKVYTATFPAGGTVPLFAITADAGATSKTVDFHLVTPCEGCNIGFPGTESVMITGSASITRVDITQSYCKPDQKVTSSNKDEVDCVTMAQRPNCGPNLQKGEWIYPYCFPSETITENSEWTCGTNTPIFLLSPMNISEYCDVFILDTIETPGNESYELHASIKRKPRILNVNIAGEGVGSDVKTIVKSATTGSFSEVTTCKDIDSKHKQCEVFAGDNILITFEKGSSIFNYWSCDEGDCKDNPVRSFSEFEMLVSSAAISSVTAHFNDRDEHCFYDNFNSRENSRNMVNEEFKVFCPSSSYRNCIDKCANGELNCSAGEDYRIDHEANWRMVYPNKYDLTCSNRFGITCIKWDKAPVSVPPAISGGSISAPRGGILADYLPTVLLNTVKAGFDGEATVMMRIPIIISDVVDKLLGEHYYDDGIILRSNKNATQYISLNIFGDVLKRAKARVCYVTSQEVENTGNCAEKLFQLKYGTEYVPITALTPITVKANIHGSTLDVELDYNFGKAGSFDAGTVSFDLTALPSTLQNTEGQEYVGLKMSNDDIIYSDFTWSSDTYANECWDTPQIYCSFRNKYIGGWVPKDEAVVPWYAKSNWFDENNCPNPTFHYNGCDYSSAYNYGYMTLRRCTRASDIGPFWTLGDKIDSDEYSFSEEGSHGYYWSENILGLPQTGNAREASIRIICNQKTYTASCGEFNVGELESCHKHEVVSSTETSCNASEECFIWNDENKILNIRDATLAITISDLGENEVSIELLDDTSIEGAIGNRSKISKFTGDGTKYINVGDIIDAYGFNPQKFKGLTLKSSASFKVTYVMSACSNALGISQCSADFNGSQWNISANVTNPREAAGCRVIDSDKNVLYEGDCPSRGSTFAIEATSIYKELEDYKIDSKDYTFKIEVTPRKDDIDPPSCITNTVTVGKQTLECDISPEPINAGENAPSFKFYASNCPMAGCMVHVNLESDVWSADLNYKKSCATGSSACEYSVWSPDVFNTVGNNTYTYTATLSTGAKCSKSFEVKGSTENAKATKCYLDGTSFKAEIDAPESGSKVKLYYTDPIGNILGTDQIIMKGSSTYEQSLSGLAISGSYVLALFIDGKQACESIEYPTKTPATPGSGSSSGSNPEDTPNQCDCKCKTGCDNIITTGWDPTNKTACYFTTGDYSSTGERPMIHPWNNSVVNVNGIKFTNKSAQIYDIHNETGAVGNMSDKKVDGGFYVQFEEVHSGIEVKFFGGTPNCTESITPTTVPVSVTCPETVQEVENGKDITISTTSVSGCDGGCKYSVSGTSLQDDSYSYRNGSVGIVTVYGDANENKSYELTLTNLDGNFDKCTIKAKIKAAASADGSANCSYSAEDELYVGDPLKFTANSIEPSTTVHLEYLIDGFAEYEGDYWAPNGFSREYSFSTAIEHKVQLKINSKIVCERTITVKEIPANVFNIQDGGRYLEAGEWSLRSCKNATGTKTIQLTGGSSTDCLQWFSPALNWTNKWGTCSGQAIIEFPTTVTVPEGENLNIGGCW